MPINCISSLWYNPRERKRQRWIDPHALQQDSIQVFHRRSGCCCDLAVILEFRANLIFQFLQNLRVSLEIIGDTCQCRSCCLASRNHKVRRMCCDLYFRYLVCFTGVKDSCDEIWSIGLFIYSPVIVSV